MSPKHAIPTSIVIILFSQYFGRGPQCLDTLLKAVTYKGRKYRKKASGSLSV